MKKSAVFLVAALALLVVILAGPSALAALKTTAQYEAAAKAFCGGGGVPSPDSACRNGYRWGYDTRQTVQETCVNRSGYTSAMETKCKKGYAEGKKERAKDAPSASTGSKGKLKIDPSRIDNIPSNSNSDDLLQKILGAVYILAGTVAIITIIYGGFMYITSEGDSAKAANAKNAVLYAVIGLIIVGLAFIITGVIQNIANA